MSYDRLVRSVASVDTAPKQSDAPEQAHCTAISKNLKQETGALYDLSYGTDGPAGPGPLTNELTAICVRIDAVLADVGSLHGSADYMHAEIAPTLDALVITFGKLIQGLLHARRQVHPDKTLEKIVQPRQETAQKAHVALKALASRARS